MSLSNALIAACLLFAGAPLKYVQDVPDTLDVALVSSKRGGALAASVPVRPITSSDIVRSGAKNLDEVLRTFAGISVRDYGGIGGLKTVSVRNLGSQHTSVCYDGIPVSDAQNGQVDIGRFNLDNVSRVSVTIGGTDDIFRSARHLTSAGIIEISSAKPNYEQGPVQITARLSAASFGTYSPYILYSQRLCPGWSVSASANYLSSKGNYPFVLQNGTLSTNEKRLNSDVSTVNSEINVSGSTKKGGELAVKAFYTDSERGLPGSVVLYTRNSEERLWDRNLVANAMYTDNFGDKWKVRASIGFSRAYSRYVDTDPAYYVPEDNRYLQKEYSISAIAGYSPSECLQFVLAEDFWINSLDSNIPECLFPVRYSSVTAVSARYLTERLSATASIVETFNCETVRRGTPAPDRQRFSPAFSISYKVMEEEELRVRVSFKDGFRMPTFNDLYYARVGNASLLPEKAFQANVGITWSRQLEGGLFAFMADGYFNKVEDKIVAIPTMFIWKMRNVGKVLMAGTDLTASFHYNYSDWLVMDADACWSFQYAADVTDKQAKNYGHQIPYTPKQTGSLTVGFETPWVNVSYVMCAVGERFFLAQNIPEHRIEPYADHGLSISRTFEFGRRRRYGIYVGAEALNLGNNNYEIVRYYPMPGRNWRLTLKLTY